MIDLYLVVIEEKNQFFKVSIINKMPHIGKMIIGETFCEMGPALGDN